MKDLLELREGSAAGLIVYSGSAHLVMPLTRDHQIIHTMIEQLTPDMMPEEGDALAAAMTRAVQLLQYAGVAGSVLVMTDAVASDQATALNKLNVRPPVQFLAVQPPSSSVDAGIKEAAKATGGSITSLTVDNQDIVRMNARAESDLQRAVATSADSRWQDGGFYLLPFLAICALGWFRKGWSLWSN